jgi:hypothetical protein
LASTLLTQHKLGWQAATWQPVLLLAVQAQVQAQVQTQQPAQQQLRQVLACWGTSWAQAKRLLVPLQSTFQQQAVSAPQHSKAVQMMLTQLAGPQLLTR